jgi:hypothetical protein
MVIAENYKLWLSCHFISVKPIAIAQQGRTDLAESSVLLPIKKNPKLCIQKCNTDPRWGPVMTISMGKTNVTWTKY